jgi:peptidoglycan/xylan/chitin deacetylase (PgdA/CDA1 family)
MISEFQYEMMLFRYPEGSYNEQTLALINELGYKTLFWSFAYADWDVNSQKDEGEALELLKKRTHNGAIYLLHCVSSTNANILGDYIDYLRNEGYSIELFPTN